MLQAAADTLIRTRGMMAKGLKDLTAEQWLAQPDGFANNIAWNVGHLVLAQQGLCYSLLGVAAPLGAEAMQAMRPLYGGGSSPADWTETPDTDELLRLLVELPQRLTEDIAAGKFDEYVMPEPVEGQFPPAQSVMHGLLFNQFHEDLTKTSIFPLNLLKMLMISLHGNCKFHPNS